MGIGQTMLLGFIAGVTILIGMPLGRMRRPARPPGDAQRAGGGRAAVLGLGRPLGGVGADRRGARRLITRPAPASAPRSATACCSSLGLSVGLLGLQQYEAWMGRRVRRLRAQAEQQSLGPGAMASQELATRGHPHLVAGPSARAADRGGHRPPQLRRGPRHRPGRRRQRDRHGDPAGDRLRPPQRHRGLRHRRPARRRDRRRPGLPAELGAAPRCWPRSAAVRRSSAPSSATRSPASRCRSSS